MSTVRKYAGAGLVSIDAKGRMTLPSDIRDTVFASSGGQKVCISVHPTLDCLTGFGEAELDRKMDDIDYAWKQSVGNGDKDYDMEAAASADYGLSFTANCESSGRFVLNSDLRTMVELEDRAFIYGAGRHFCIWNPFKFRQEELRPEYKRLHRFLDMQLKKEGLL